MNKECQKLLNIAKFKHINDTDWDDYTLLMILCDESNIQINPIKILLDAGINVNYVRSIGNIRSAIHFAVINAIKQKTIEVVQLLIDAKADLNLCDKYPKIDPLLIIVFMYSDLNDPFTNTLASVLIKGGAKINLLYMPILRNYYNISCIRNKNVIKKLIEFGADVNSTDSDGNTPLMLISEIEYVQVLLDGGSNINHQNNNGDTVFILAIKRDDDLFINKLIEANVDIHIVDNKYQNALMHAVKKDNIKCIKMLIDKGANINAVDNEKRTALSYAISFEAVKLLLEANANIHIEDRHHTTVITYIARQKNIKRKDETIRLLIKYGAKLTDKNNNTLHGLEKYAHEIEIMNLKDEIETLRESSLPGSTFLDDAYKLYIEGPQNFEEDNIKKVAENITSHVQEQIIKIFMEKMKNN